MFMKLSHVLSCAVMPWMVPLKNGPPGRGWSHPWHGIQRVSRLTSGPGRMKLDMPSVLGWVFKASYVNNGT